MDLVQGEMSVIKYVAKFDELSRYGYVIIDTDIRRKKWFIKGLRPEIAREPCHISMILVI